MNILAAATNKRVSSGSRNRSPPLSAIGPNCLPAVVYVSAQDAGQAGLSPHADLAGKVHGQEEG